MHLNPRLAQRLETYEPDRLKAILMWFNADSQSFGAASNRLGAILNEVESLTMDSCYQLASHLELTELVHVSILNEFGPAVERKAYFPALTRSVSNRLAEPALLS